MEKFRYKVKHINLGVDKIRLMMNEKYYYIETN